MTEAVKNSFPRRSINWTSAIETDDCIYGKKISQRGKFDLVSSETSHTIEMLVDMEAAEVTFCLDGGTAEAVLSLPPDAVTCGVVPSVGIRKGGRISICGM